VDIPPFIFVSTRRQNFDLLFQRSIVVQDFPATDNILRGKYPLVLEDKIKLLKKRYFGLE
jgi:hypothetical protein